MEGGGSVSYYISLTSNMYDIRAIGNTQHYRKMKTKPTDISRVTTSDNAGVDNGRH